jgi:hypothetical protein
MSMELSNHFSPTFEASIMMYRNLLNHLCHNNLEINNHKSINLHQLKFEIFNNYPNMFEQNPLRL